MGVYLREKDDLGYGWSHYPQRATRDGADFTKIDRKVHLSSLRKQSQPLRKRNNTKR